MSEYSVWYVLKDQQRFVGRAHEIADAFWELGVFLTTSDRRIEKRVAEWRAQGKPLPAWRHDFAFSAMGLCDEVDGDIVPNLIYDLSCPECSEVLSDDAYEVLEDEEPGEITRRAITCPHCDAVFPASRLVSKDTPFTFAKVYIWVGDIDNDEWDSSFRETVEKVFGPCEEFFSWET